MVGEPVSDGFGAVCGELFVGFFGSDVVGEAFDADFPIRVIFQRGQDGIQSGFGVRGDVGFAGFEPEVVERDARFLGERSVDVGAGAATVAIEFGDEGFRGGRRCGFAGKDAAIGDLLAVEFFVFAIVGAEG